MAMIRNAIMLLVVVLPLKILGMPSAYNTAKAIAKTIDAIRISRNSLYSIINFPFIFNIKGGHPRWQTAVHRVYPYHLLHPRILQALRPQLRAALFPASPDSSWRQSHRAGLRRLRYGLDALLPTPSGFGPACSGLTALPQILFFLDNIFVGSFGEYKDLFFQEKGFV